MANVKMVAIGEVIGKYFNMDSKTINSKTRKREICKPRQYCHHFAYEYKAASLSKIGYYFGHKDHSTVLHSYNIISRDASLDKMEAATYESINKLIKARFKTDLSPNNKISELDMVKAVKRSLNDVNSRIMFNLLLKEHSFNKFNHSKIMHKNVVKDKQQPMILQISKEGSVVGKFKNKEDIVKEFNFDSSNLDKVLDRVIKTIGGYKFIYERDYETTKSRRIS